MVSGHKKNVCQNPKCCLSSTKDRWNKKIGRYQSRKAYFKVGNSRGWKILQYFCTTSCSGRWLEDNLESIIDHRGTIEKILEKKIRA